MTTVPRLHVIAADDVLERADFVETAAALMAVDAGGVAVHLRAHGRRGGEVYALAERLATAARATGALLVVNDRVDVALALVDAGVGAVQLGARSLPVGAVRGLLPAHVLLGRSTHETEESAAAAADGADWLLLGTIYRTASHPDRAGAGLPLVAETVSRTRAPVIAIGGITPGRVAGVLGAGAHGVAVLRGVWSASDPRAALRSYLEELERFTP